MATFTGTAGNDKLIGTTGADTMIGLAGDDTYTVNNCDDVVTEAASAGIDTVNSSVAYALTADVENLILGGTYSIDGTGNGLDNKIVGNGAANRLTTDDGKDTVSGGAGNDTVVSAGFLDDKDQIDGGTGTDTLVLGGPTALTFTATTVIGVERFKLTAGSDYDLTLADATNNASLTIDGSQLGAGDTLEVNGSAETKAALTVLGGADADTVIGGVGNDVFNGGAGADSLVGGGGTNTVSYAGSSAGVTIDLTVGTQGGGGDGAGDTLSGFVNVVGSDFGDQLKGTTGTNSLSGGDGADTLIANGGNDTLRGGAGADVLELGNDLKSTDVVDGGDGLDTLNLDGNSYAAGVTFGTNVVGIEEIDLAAGFSYKLTLSTTTNAGGLLVDGSALGVGNNLTLSATAESDSSLTAFGGAGNDSISAGALGDTLTGGSGKDTLLGGGGDDLFNVGGNLDALDKVDGGVGLDTLQFDGDTLGIVFGAATVTNVETFLFAAGKDYDIKLNGTTVATALTVDGSALGAGDGLAVDASLETTGKFTVFGGAGNDKFVGGGGADTVYGSIGSDTITGGAGLDTLSYAASAAAVGIDLSFAGAQSGGDAAGDVIAGIETLIGSAGDDDLYGDASANSIQGGAGSDFIGGGTGGVSGGNDTLSGEADNDVFDMFDALTATDRLDGGDGFDTLILDGNYAGLTFGTTTAINVEQIILWGGSKYNLTLNDAITAGDLVIDGALLGATETMRITGTSDKSNLQITGGAANDTLTGGMGADTLTGGDGNDTLNGGAGANVFVGGVGSDTMTGGTGIDTVDYSGSGAAVTVNLTTNVHAGGDAAGDKLASIENVIGSDGADKITGSSVANLLSGGKGADTLDGGTGNDTLLGGADSDVLVGGAGVDLASYAGSTAAVTVDLSLATQGGVGDASGDKFTTIEGVIGSGFNDTLTSGATNDLLYGEGGNDSLIAGTGNDTVSGGSGDDTLGFKGNGNLTGTDKVDGGDGFDVVLISGTYPSGISLTATNFANVEEIDLAAGNNYKLSINTGTVGTSVFIDGKNLAGNTLSVTATGAVGISVRGGGMADTLVGGTGSDNFFGSAGADVITGNTGVDTVDYSASGAGVTVNLGLTTVQVSAGDAAGDRLTTIENAIGSVFADTLTGTKAVNNLDGSGGNDILRGGAGADTLVGGLGNDTADYSASTAGVKIDLADSDKNAGGDAAGDRLVAVENVTGSNLNDTLSGDDNGNILSGGKGNDSLTGGLGADTLDGGDGIDTVDYSAVKDTNDDDKGVAIDLTAGTGLGEEAEGDSLIAVENLIGTDFNDTLTGSLASNALTGGAGEDSLAAGGNGTDTLLGGVDADTFDLAGKLDAADRIDGGIGITEKGGSKDYDIVQLNGDYKAGVVFGATTMTNVEEIDLAAGNHYKLTLNNATNANGLLVDGSTLGATDTLTLIGSAETSAGLTAKGGAGADSIVGGAGADVISGGAGSDTLDGGKGNNDTVDYSGSVAGVTVNLLTNVNAGGDAAGDSLSGFENVTGSAQNDTITGDKNANLLIGGAGADSIDGGEGIDTASYAASTDAVTVDLVTNVNKGGDAEGDTLTGFEVVIGSGKGDAITGRDDKDERLDGGDGSDTLGGGNGNDSLVGGAGDDQLSDGDGNDSVVGDTGGDLFIAGDGNDTLKGGDDADTFKVGQFLNALDRIDGGTSFVTGSDPQVPHNDTLVLAGDYATVPLTFTAAMVVNMETIAVTDGFNYNLKLDNATNTAGLAVDGGALTGTSYLYLDGSKETMSALTAIGGAAADILIGGGGADLFTGGVGADTLTGNGGIDTASYKGSAAAVSVDLTTNINTKGDAAGDVLAGIENLIGSDNDDTLVGSAVNNTLEGGLGADSLDGKAGLDVVSYENSKAAVTIDLASAGAQVGGDAAGDTLADIEGVVGSDHDDLITGTGSANLISGGKGNDTLNAECGNDTVSGGNGDDEIGLTHDFTAADRIDGGDGTDTLFLDGNYAAGVVLGAATLVNVEAIQLAAGNHYRFTLHDAANTSGLSIDGSKLGSDETLYINGQSETSNGLTATGGAGNDTLIGGAKNDLLTAGAGDDVLTGNAGVDVLDGGAGNDSVNGGDGGDALAAGAGTDTLIGGADGDTFQLAGFLGSADRIDGGVGDDKLVLDGDYAGGVVFGAATMINVETITVTDGFSYRLILDNATNSAGLTVNAGTLTGGNSLYLDGSKETASNLTVTGGAGDDTILGGAGSDSVVGGAGADSLRGGNGIDTLSYVASGAGVNVSLASSAPQTGGDAAGDVTSGFENLIGSAFDDTLTGSAADNLFVGGAGGDAFNGGLGVDTVSYADSKAGGVWVDLSDGTGSSGDAAGDTYTAIENIIGTAESDVIIGDGAANRLEGRGGEDYLEGGGGNDTLIGGGEDDYLVGGAGADSIDGAGGSDDWASYEGSTAGVTIDLSLETAQVSGGHGNGDILVSIANLVGSDFNDKLIGDGQDNKIEGGDGADFIDGGDGFDYVLYEDSDDAVFIDFNSSGAQKGGDAQGDILAESEGVTGSAFNDRLIGDGEANALYGNGGADTLTGGALNDIFGFNSIDAVDVITDFQVGVGGDELHIGNILTGYNGDINDFVRIVSKGGQTMLQIDTNGGGDSFQDCAILVGVSSGVSVDALLANGQIDPFPGTV